MKTQRFNYSTAILKCSTGVFIIVGAVPMCFNGKHYKTEQEVVDDLLSIGLTKFQRDDCSWYNENGKTVYDLLNNRGIK